MRRAAAAVAGVVLATGCGASSPSPGPAPLRVTVARGGLADDVATAVAVGPGRVLTVAHVLDGARRVRVAGHPARVLRADARLDAAILAVPGLEARVPALATGGAAGELHVLRRGGARVLHVVIRRHVTARLDAGSRPALELGATVRPGDSGSPISDDAGRLVGIVFAAAADGSSTAWAVDARALETLLGFGRRSARGPRPDHAS